MVGLRLSRRRRAWGNAQFVAAVNSYVKQGQRAVQAYGELVIYVRHFPPGASVPGHKFCKKLITSIYKLYREYVWRTNCAFADSSKSIQTDGHSAGCIPWKQHQYV